VKKDGQRGAGDKISKKQQEKQEKAGVHQPFEALKALKAKMESDEKEKAKDKGKPTAPAPVAKRPISKAPPSASSSDDEALTFHRMMSGVVPIDRAKSRIPTSQSSLPRSSAAEAAARRANARSAREAEEAQVHEHLRSLVEGRTRFEVQDDGRRVEGRRMDVPPDVVRKLRRGVMPIDGRLDLHGSGAHAARESLHAFLKEKRARGERCVLVVHGKGEHSPNAMGVLRGEMAAWLSQSAASEHVAAFATATEDDGGEGAVYVLLRPRG
jgi:DNA-nicking Smr family endonuclease